MRATIDQEGRIALGPELQKQLGVHPGDDVDLEQRSGEWTIKAARAKTGLCFEGNVLVHRGSSPASSDDPLASVRGERLEQLNEGLPQ
jgi:bifunctional DNA-binding transcriptional regulator/antitoxin component of YhaV-PrlF toxin-antitoxin module